MKWLDNFSEHGTRNLARHAARRGFLSRFGAVLVGAAVFPTLPVTLAPYLGSTMVRVCTKFTGPGRLKISCPSRKKGRSSEKKSGKRWLTSI